VSHCRRFLSLILPVLLVPALAGPSAAAQIGRPGERSEGGKLHALLVAVTDDPGVGRSAAVNLKNLRALLEDGFKDHADRLDLKILGGQQASLQEVRRYLDALTIGPDDTLLVYINCHGANLEGVGHAMQLQHGAISRTDLRRMVLDRGARLTLLLTDSCNAFHQPEEVRAGPGTPEWDTLRCLLLEGDGLLDLNSSREGEYAFCFPTLGALFTAALGDTLRMPFARLDRNRDGFLHWEEVLPLVQQGTRGYYTKLTRAIAKKVENLPRDSEDRQEWTDTLNILRKQGDQSLRVYSLPATDRFGVRVLDNDGEGVVVGVVQDHTAAARSGLKAGDVILRVGGKEIKGAGQLGQVINDSKGEVEVEYLRLPGKEVQRCKVRLGRWPVVRGL
jgi:hypothetical protein